MTHVGDGRGTAAEGWAGLPAMDAGGAIEGTAGAPVFSGGRLEGETGDGDAGFEAPDAGRVGIVADLAPLAGDATWSLAGCRIRQPSQNTPSTPARRASPTRAAGDPLRRLTGV